MVTIRMDGRASGVGIPQSFRAERIGARERLVPLFVRTGMRAVSLMVLVVRSTTAPTPSQREGVIARKVALDTPMLMLFKQNGRVEQEWRGTPFYWPVIWVQKNVKTAIFAQERWHRCLQRSARIVPRMAKAPKAKKPVGKTADSYLHPTDTSPDAARDRTRRTSAKKRCRGRIATIRRCRRLSSGTAE